MGFLKPKIPTTPPPPNAATPSIDPYDPYSADASTGLAASAQSLVSTTSQGLKRRADVNRRTLIGG